MGVKKKKEKIISGIYLEPQIQITSSKPISNLSVIKIFQFMIIFITCRTLISCFATSLEIEYDKNAFLYNFSLILLFSLSFLVLSLNKYRFAAVSAYLLFHAMIAREYFKELADGLIVVTNRIIENYNIYFDTNYLKYKTYGYDDEKAVSVFFVIVFGLFSLVMCDILINVRKYWLYIAICLPFIGLPLYVGRIPESKSFLLFFILTISVFAADSASTRLNKKKLGRIYSKNKKEYYNNKIKEKHFSERISVKIESILFLMSFIAVIAVVLIFPESIYQKNVKSLEKMKENIQLAIEDFDINKFINGISIIGVYGDSGDVSGGISHGKMGKTGEIKYDNKPDLKITLPVSIKEEPETIYLKGYTGNRYSNDNWIDTLDVNARKKYSDLNEKLKANGWIEENQSSDILKYISYISKENIYKVYDMEIEKLDMGILDSLIPYAPVIKPKFDLGEGIIEPDYFYKNKDKYSISFCIPHMNAYPMGKDNYINKVLSDIDYYGLNNENLKRYGENESKYREFVYDTYTSITEDLYPQTVKFVEDNNLIHKDTDEVIEFIKYYLDKETIYTLSPGVVPDDKNFLDYFLFESKKGYCVYYATAGVIMLRAAGIPARYAEGYIIGSSNIRNAEEFGDKISINIPDSNAHAWAEIYIDGYGWQPVEFTKSYEGASVTPKPEITPIPEPEKTKEPVVSMKPSAIPEPTGTADIKEHEETFKPFGDLKETDSSIFDKFVNIILKVIILLLVVCIAIFVRSIIVKQKRKRKLSNKNIKYRTSYLYGEFIDVLFRIIMKSEFGFNDKSDITEEIIMEKADEFERFLHGKTEGNIKNSMDYFIKSVYSEEGITEKEFIYLKEVYYNMIEVMYENTKNRKMSFLRKMYIRYILCY